MTLALLIGPAADSARQARLTDQLRRAGATAFAAPDTAAELAALLRDGDGPVLVVAADLVAHDAVLRLLATEPGERSVALTGDGDGLRVLPARGMVVRAGEGPVAFLGALRVAGSDRAACAAATAAHAATADRAAQAATADRAAHAATADRAAQAATGAPAGRTAPDGRPGTVVATDRAGDDLIDALVSAFVPAGRLHAYPLRLVKARRCASGAAAAEAEAEIAGVDEGRALLRLAVKERDDFVATVLVSSWSPVLTRACARLGLSPSAVTAISVLCALGAALGFAQASRTAMIAGAVLLYLGFVLDCVDGQVARFTRRFTPLGGWLDTMADRAKEYLVYAGLAAGAVRLGHDEGWWLAIAAMALQTVRHATDHWYGVLHDVAAPLARPGGALGRLSDRVIAEGRSPVYWLKRIVVFPIGERWALIAVTAALAGGRAALLAVLGWGAAAMVYTLALRGLRSYGMRVSVPVTSRQRDDGWLARRLPSPAGRLDWLLPAVLRLAEYAAVIGAAVLHRVPPPLVFLLLLAVAMHHYDLAARPGSRWSPRCEPGWDGRALVVLACGSVAFPVLAAWTLGVLGRRVAASTTRTRQARLPVQAPAAGDAERDLAAGRQAR
ncbi:CDP-alcohol phosphatidyltransferase family protein [Catenuloplanes japonicus]|uniref:CDP-alcohol phosphatidyltransferase family protein n=1 Tax=Catenuloplanes japonicus TaxID=33876 RepID=UPI0006896C39|nr:CDP-alcohol phosphatidyltransferase family protein [Catenuloplanes japonicus]